MSEKEQEQGQEIEELDSFDFEGTGFNDEVNEVTFPPTILEIMSLDIPAAMNGKSLLVK